MFFTKLQEYSMHKSVMVLSMFFLGFDLSAVKHAQHSEARRLAALGIDCKMVASTSKKGESSVTELALLKRCKQLKLENAELRSKLAVSPDELSKGGEASNPDRLSLDSGSSSSGTSPVLIKESIFRTTSPLAIPQEKGKEEQCVTNFPVCESPCGFWMPSSAIISSSFPKDGYLLSGGKRVSPLVPYCDCP